MKANYKIIEDGNDFLVIRDVGPWDRFSTVTNAAEEVVAELAPRLGGRRLLYVDSSGIKDELLVKHGRFIGFAAL